MRTTARPTRQAGGDQRKHKFYATASCIVEKINGTKRSVALMLLDGKPPGLASGTSRFRRTTKFSTKGRDRGGPLPIYAYDGGSLYQPVFIWECGTI